MSTVYFLLSAFCCLLSTVCCLLPTVCCLLSAIYRLLSGVYCLSLRFHLLSHVCPWCFSCSSVAGILLLSTLASFACVFSINISSHAHSQNKLTTLTFYESFVTGRSGAPLEQAFCHCPLLHVFKGTTHHSHRKFIRPLNTLITFWGGARLCTRYGISSVLKLRSNKILHSINACPLATNITSTTKMKHFG
jgi:hypothetical protein